MVSEKQFSYFSQSEKNSNMSYERGFVNQWFKKERSDTENLQNIHRGKPSLGIMNGQLSILVKENPQLTILKTS